MFSEIDGVNINQFETISEFRTLFQTIRTETIELWEDAISNKTLEEIRDEFNDIMDDILGSFDDPTEREIARIVVISFAISAGVQVSILGGSSIAILALALLVL